jgi:hypothetical protein
MSGEEARDKFAWTIFFLTQSYLKVPKFISTTLRDNGRTAEIHFAGPLRDVAGAGK